MAKARSSSSRPTRKSGNLWTTSLWLIMALLSGVTALVLWMFSSAPVFDDKAQKSVTPSEEVAVSSIRQVNHIDEVHELDDAIRPISFGTLVKDLRHYPPEFKDKKFFKKYKRKWTVQVMDVSEHDIITDYLNTREDKKKFAYFRYRDADNQERYILTYDRMSSPQLAKGASTTIDFALPSDIVVEPVKISDLLEIIDNYELSVPVTNLSAERFKDIELKPTKREIRAKTSTNNKPKTTQNNSQNTSQSKKRDGEGQNNASNAQAASTASQGQSSNNDQNRTAPQAQGSAPTQNSSANASSNAGRATGNQNTANPQKQESTNNKPAPATAEVDKIKQLIEEKTQQ